VAARSLRGRVVVVTGASSGIGRAVATTLHRQGAQLVLGARGADRLAAVERSLPGVAVVAGDVQERATRERLVGTALDRHGRIDALVNNAGVGWLGLVEDMPADALDNLVATNVTAVLDLTRLVLPHLLEARDGDIVMMSSIAAWSSVPPLTVYCATKHAVNGLTKGLRREVTARGVRVHSVNPGPVSTEWLARSEGYAPAEGEDGQRRRSRGVPPALVAHHVRRCLTAGHSRTVAVPRLAGLARLGDMAPVNRVLDRLLSVNAEGLGRWGARQADERSQPPYPGRLDG
jgi:NADP-dependent 3-hydroxy acid dehydrogenase YdfG